MLSLLRIPIESSSVLVYLLSIFLALGHNCLTFRKRISSGPAGSEKKSED